MKINCLAAIALSLVLCGCGGGGDSEPDTVVITVPLPTGEPTTEPQDDETVPVAGWTQIASVCSGTQRFCEPLALLSNENGLTMVHSEFDDGNFLVQTPIIGDLTLNFGAIEPFIVGYNNERLLAWNRDLYDFQNGEIQSLPQFSSVIDVANGGNDQVVIGRSSVTARNLISINGQAREYNGLIELEGEMVDPSIATNFICGFDSADSVQIVATALLSERPDPLFVLNFPKDGSPDSFFLFENMLDGVLPARCNFNSEGQQVFVTQSNSGVSHYIDWEFQETFPGRVLRGSFLDPLGFIAVNRLGDSGTIVVTDNGPIEAPPRGEFLTSFEGIRYLVTHELQTNAREIIVWQQDQ